MEDMTMTTTSKGGSEDTTATMSVHKRRVLTDDGVTIAYTVHGDGPRTLLFLHGWGGSGSGFFWSEMLAHLDLTGLRVCLADLRGHGASDQATTGFTTERFAQDMFAVADDAAADAVVLVAYSMSGRWAQWMACMQPDRIRGQVLIAPAPAADIPIPDDLKQQWLNSVQQRDTFEPWLRQFTKEPLRPEVVECYFSEVATTPQRSLSETLDMCRQGGQFMDKLPATCAATLVIGGHHDPLLSPDTLRQAIVGPIPRARLVLLDCGHETPLEKPQATAALLEAFLAGLG
jgi:pimeloyl-ACP methyl ester carboxylesterase